MVASSCQTREEYDRREAALSVARADVTQALEDAHQIRVSLGLPAEPENGGRPGPSAARPRSDVLLGSQAQSELIQSAAELGVIHSYNQTPKQMVEEFAKQNPQGNVDQILAQLVPGAPAVKQAKANLEAAKSDLAQAELNLRYCDIVAEIDGVVTRRNVNPGNNVLVGQSLMAIRSLDEIWVDANFKETQLRDLRIGQPVDLYVDMYGGRRVFPGRIAGFTMGTGSTLALLPPQNATGNFVKVVQRLPVRIELAKLRPKQRTSVHRPVGGSIRLPEQAGDRTRCRKGSANLLAAIVGHSRFGEPGSDQMTLAAASLRGSRAGVNPWLVAAAVIVPTFMEVLDTTIAVVALRYIAGGLSATVNDGEWVITSYLAANAIILPITGWLTVRFGRRNYFLFSILVFTVASALCGMATSLNQLILFRVIQGLAGGGLQPCSQGVLLDAFPPEKQGTAMTLFGLAALVAPVVGPTLGGWITDDYSWRWVFYINVPIGLLAFAACYAVVHDPDYLTAQRAEQRRQPSRFDSIGLSLLVITMVCWEVMLSKGEEWDWLGDPFGRVQTLAALLHRGARRVDLLGTASPQSCG